MNAPEVLVSLVAEPCSALQEEALTSSQASASGTTGCGTRFLKKASSVSTSASTSGSRRCRTGSDDHLMLAVQSADNFDSPVIDVICTAHANIASAAAFSAPAAQAGAASMHFV